MLTAAQTSWLLTRRRRWRSRVPLPFTADGFNGADGTFITAHRGELDADWLLHPAHTPATPVTIAGGGAYAPVSVGLYYTSAPDIEDAYVEAEIDFKSNVGNVNYGPAGRLSVSANTMYHARYNTSTGAWELYRFVAGVASLLQSVTEAFPTGQKRRLGLKMIGTSICMAVDGVEGAPVTDASVTAAGRCGLRFGGSGITATTGIHVSSFMSRPAQ